MELLYNNIFLEHETGSHPENKKRLDAFKHLPNTHYPDAREWLRLVHTEAYIQQVEKACADGKWLDMDTITSSNSFLVATAGVGLAMRAMEEKAFAIMRPPGHHAYPDKASGFCLFNTIAVVAQYLVNEGKKVLIFDFDGHLGDGTEAIFYNTDQVLFWSLHQYPAFPGNGYIDEIGMGKGKGYSINVPLPSGTGDDIFLKAVQEFMPVVEQFKPDVVAVSAGFDAHLYDPLLGLRITGSTYYKIGAMLKERFDHVFAILEGGYNLEYMPKSAYNFLAGFNSRPMPFEEVPTTSGWKVWESFDTDLQALFSQLAPYWKL
jgi:acetoin utilization deacetylase AcuC-like enzyme